MGTGELNAGSETCDGLASLSGESRNIPSHFRSLQATETGISSGLMGHLAPIQTLPPIPGIILELVCN